MGFCWEVRLENVAADSLLRKGHPDADAEVTFSLYLDHGSHKEVIGYVAAVIDGRNRIIDGTGVFIHDLELSLEDVLEELPKVPHYQDVAAQLLEHRGSIVNDGISEEAKLSQHALRVDARIRAKAKEWAADREQKQMLSLKLRETRTTMERLNRRRQKK
ncbi:MAG: hypothetical protein A2751_04610 [Candidatus Doudnabacteria bacterium RIFCSPHIGHO2_01_FULL_46_14]|uniref:Uncharacterized protein n=1 Tax=Candidatus Doudnabacteria bacterium RIFCSPHIGHO2_01_FULL_46_14 TaxID=1817824 RepID=A0A1F5NNZ3_9BACT|nr:MAG: hypothetical protein A2751_04610 [Candidatus Doudnabacteria bacterium RIFCSPHIGHO2_01_FULL_46_14]